MEKKKFDINEFYNEKFDNYLILEKFKPIILLALMEMFERIYSLGYERGKRIENIRHTNRINNRLDKLIKNLENQ